MALFNSYVSLSRGLLVLNGAVFYGISDDLSNQEWWSQWELLGPYMVCYNGDTVEYTYNRTTII